MLGVVLVLEELVYSAHPEETVPCPISPHIPPLTNTTALCTGDHTIRIWDMASYTCARLLGGGVDGDMHGGHSNAVYSLLPRRDNCLARRLLPHNIPSIPPIQLTCSVLCGSFTFLGVSTK